MPLELKQRPNGIFYVSGTVTVWRNGRSHSIEVRRSTKVRSFREADAIRRQIEAQVSEQNHTNRQPSISFDEAAARYLKNGGSPRYLDKVKAAIGHTRIDDITQQVLDDEGLKAYPANTATRRRQFHTPAIAVLKANGIRQSFDRPSEGAPRTVFIRPEVAVAIIARTVDSRYPNYWTPALVTFLFGQGSRVGETLAIDGRDDISLDDRYAVLRDTKNGHERMVPLCPRTIAALTPLPNLGKPGPLFLRYDGRPYVPHEVRGYEMRFWDRVVTEAGLDPKIYTPHSARHSWATWHYSQNKDVIRLKAEGGWLSNAWTRYPKLANKSIGQTAIKLGFDFRERDGNEPGTNFAESLRA